MPTGKIARYHGEAREAAPRRQRVSGRAVVVGAAVGEDRRGQWGRGLRRPGGNEVEIGADDRGHDGHHFGTFEQFFRDGFVVMRDEADEFEIRDVEVCDWQPVERRRHAAGKEESAGRDTGSSLLQLSRDGESQHCSHAVAEERKWPGGRARQLVGDGGHEAGKGRDGRLREPVFAARILERSNVQAGGRCGGLPAMEDRRAGARVREAIEFGSAARIAFAAEKRRFHRESEGAEQRGDRGKS